jgi:hypothetical protein
MPVLNPDGVWDELQRMYALTDDAVDAVAIYQNFATDIALTFTAAYSTAGNAGADGYSTVAGTGSAQPRFPSLMHLGNVREAYNSDREFATTLFLHEFGHRWLYFVAFNDGGTISHDLAPDGAHPAAWVDTRAAFRVLTSRDASVMGGGWFEQQSDGRWTTSSEFTPNGYSWLELYLMGLAAPEEVAPFFYLRNTNPPLDDAYWAPPGVRVSGTRKDVTVQQVIDVMKPRFPAYPAAQRKQKVLVVLLNGKGQTVSEDDLASVQQKRADFARNFSLATGGRGEIDAAFRDPAPITRRRPSAR